MDLFLVSLLDFSAVVGVISTHLHKWCRPQLCLLSPRPLQAVDPALIARSFALPLIQSMYQAPAIRPPLLRQDALRPSTPEVQVVPIGDQDVQVDEAGRVISPRPLTSTAAANGSLFPW